MINQVWTLYFVSSVEDNKDSQINGLMQERYNSIANAVELCLSSINPSKWQCSLPSVERSQDSTTYFDRRIKTYKSITISWVNRK